MSNNTISPIYLDNASTTPLLREVVEAMLPFYENTFGNPSSVHTFGRSAKRAIERTRDILAETLNCEPDEIYFTSGGTEADNWALVQIKAMPGKGIITSSIEHHAILNTAADLSKSGVNVNYLPCSESGLITTNALTNAINTNTGIVSVMAANNETGVIQPIKELAQIAHENGALFHTDAVQAFGILPINVKEMGIDMLSLSAHKFNGPKGIGALYIKKGIIPKRLMFGGDQERKLRPGTENVPAIVGMGKAIEIASANKEKYRQHLTALNDTFTSIVLNGFPQAKINGTGEKLPGTVNIAFTGVGGDRLLVNLDMQGVMCSSGAACTAGSPEPSHVLGAMGYTDERIKSSLRFSFGKTNTIQEVTRAANIVVAAANNLRERAN